MKSKSLLAILALVLTAFGVSAQTVNVTNAVGELTTNTIQVTALDNAITALGIGVTNYSVNLYGTYAPKAPSGSPKLGGGVIGFYDFNQNVAAGVGLDWLGQFSLASANLQLQAPFHFSTILPLLENPSFPSWIHAIGNAEDVPLVLGGVGIPYSGNGHFNGSPMVISDVGDAVEFSHLYGGEFATGLVWGQWTGNGPYGGVKRYHWFIGYVHGFQ